MGQIETFTETDLTLHELGIESQRWVERRDKAARDGNMNAELNGRRDMSMLRLNHLLEVYLELGGPFKV